MAPLRASPTPDFESDADSIPVPVPVPAPVPDSDAVPLPDPDPPKLQPFQKLDVYRSALDFLTVSGDVIEQLDRGQGHVATQLQRAALSVVLNIAEGAGEHARREKSRFYRIAQRSATECTALLDVVERLHPGAEVLEGRKLLIRIVSMLTRLCKAMDQAAGKAGGSGNGGTGHARVTGDG